MQVSKCAARGSLEIQDAKMMQKNRHLCTISQLCRAISSQLRHVSTVGKKLVKQQYLLYMSAQYGELRPTSGWDHFVSLGHPCKFQLVSRLGKLCGVEQRASPMFGRRPSRWALAHILVLFTFRKWWRHTRKTQPNSLLSVECWQPIVQ